MHKINCFLLNIKELYPNFPKQSDNLTKQWYNLLTPYSVDEIISAIKKWRKTYGTSKYPNTKNFENFLAHKIEKTPPPLKNLPFNPEGYLMEQDILANRCKHLYPTYCKAVRYILNVRLKEYYTDKDFKNLNYSNRYKSAVDKGLFADFEEVLDFVKERSENYA